MSFYDAEQDESLASGLKKILHLIRFSWVIYFILAMW